MLSRMTLSATRQQYTRHAAAVASTVNNSNPTKNIAKKVLFASYSSDGAITIKPWSKGSVVETDGDYRKEAWLEKEIGGPLYQYQTSLPRLPVPDISATIERFVPTALPLARTNDEANALQQAVSKFPSQAAKLHERLLERASPSSEFKDSSWLQLWWNQLGYLQVRDSIVINVSYFFHFQDDPTCTGSQINRATSAIIALSQYRQLVCSGQLPAEQIGKGDKRKPLCSTAYKYMFHATRIPKLEQDSVKIYDPAKYNHAIIIRNGKFYAMDFCNPTTGDVYPIETIQAGLQNIISLADANDSSVTKFGYLTGINRDHWAIARQALIEQGGKDMEDALEILQSGAFVICLDKTTPISRKEVAEMLLHGNAGDTPNTQGYNRWFDKSVQIIVAENAKCGFMGEHSMMDGMPLVGLSNHITNTTYQQCIEKQQKQASHNSQVNPNVRPIFEESLLQKINTTKIHHLIEKAKHEFDSLVLQNSLNVHSFQAYGADFIKKAGFSPDAFVQMAMQLATYRLWGEQVGTYESTQVRPFLNGRTETTRTVSTESNAFVKRFHLYPLHDEHDPGARKEKLQLLTDAVNAHVKYIGLAAQAQGVDRHFFGLSMLVQDGESLPDLYNDPVFQRSKRWRVSTSHLTHPKFFGWGYGQVVPDGVGLAYSIHPRHCIFNITALKETEWTEKLSQLLEEALLEMRSVIEMEQQTNDKPKSKL